MGMGAFWGGVEKGRDRGKGHREGAESGKERGEGRGEREEEAKKRGGRNV
jgi:hypothetical protein